ARSSDAGLDRRWVSLLPSAGRVLRHDRYRCVRIRQRCRVYELSGKDNRRGGGARIEFLQRSSRWRAAGEVCVLQKRRDVGRSSKKTAKTTTNHVGTGDSPVQPSELGSALHLSFPEYCLTSDMRAGAPAPHKHLRPDT